MCARHYQVDRNWRCSERKFSIPGAYLAQELAVSSTNTKRELKIDWRGECKTKEDRRSREGGYQNNGLQGTSFRGPFSVHGILSILCHSSNASIFLFSLFLIIQLSQAFVITGKTYSFAKSTFICIDILLSFITLWRPVIAASLMTMHLIDNDMQPPSLSILAPKTEEYKLSMTSTTSPQVFVLQVRSMQPVMAPATNECDGQPRDREKMGFVG